MTVRHEDGDDRVRGLPHDSDEPKTGPEQQVTMRVPDEHSVCTRLSTRGIVVHPGSFFQPGLPRGQHICINAAAHGDGLENLAEEITMACDPRLAGGS